MSAVEVRAEAFECVHVRRGFCIHRSFYEADFVKDEQLGMTMLHGRESGRWCSRLLERERCTDLPALGRTEGSCFYPCRRGTTSIT